MGNRNTHNEKQMRILLAQAAARILVESGSQDFLSAKRKAALHMGAVDTRNMPSNAEIEQALIEYQRIFRADTQPQILENLRREAIEAMKFFKDFRPKLVGPVLNGTADEHSPVCLHLFANTSEEVGLFLMDYQVPYKLHDKRLRIGNEQFQEFPCYRFLAGQVQIEATIFPASKPSSPLSPVDGRPMQRASISDIEKLLADAHQLPNCG